MTKYSKSPLRGSGRLGRLRIKTCGDDREDVTADVGFAPQADMRGLPRYVRLVPKADIRIAAKSTAIRSPRR